MNWKSPDKYLAESGLEGERLRKLKLFIDELKPSEVADAGHKMIARWSFDLAYGVRELVDVEDAVGWAALGRQARKQIISTMLDHLMSIDKDAVLDYVEAILDQEEPVRVMARAIKVAKEATAIQVRKDSNLQSLMDQARPTVRYKKL